MATKKKKTAKRLSNGSMAAIDRILKKNKGKLMALSVSIMTLSETLSPGDLEDAVAAFITAMEKQIRKLEKKYY